jgi:hypothetical protein
MSEPAVLDWDRIVRKNARSSVGQDAGNVDAINGDSIVIISEGARKEYKIRYPNQMLNAITVRRYS